MPSTISLETTLQIRDCCLCLRVQRTARALARRFDEVLRPYDLTNGQFSLLMALNRREPPGVGTVAALLAMDRTTLTAALKPLERRGLLSIAPDPKDRRGRLIRLTAAGHTALAAALPVWQREHFELESGLAGHGDRLRADLRALDGPKAAAE